jgi:ADP-ribose pyrophosphatase YjhB (NUDIX family)
MSEANNPFTGRIFTDADQAQVPYDGSPVTWRVSAYALVIEGDQVLLIKDSLEILHDIVGGGIDLGEDLFHGLAREGLEEAGATFEIGQLLHAEQDWFYHRREGKYYQTLQLYYRARLIGELQTPTEKKIAWRGFVPISEIQKKYQVPPLVAKIIADFA